MWTLTRVGVEKLALLLLLSLTPLRSSTYTLGYPLQSFDGMASTGEGGEAAGGAEEQEEGVKLM